MSKETVHVSIFNETFSLVTDEPQEHLNQAASMVDEQMRKIAQAGFTDAQKIAVLVSLQLASKLIRQEHAAQECKETHTAVARWLEEQNRVLSDLI